MKNKGFTLIEITAVVLMLGVILLISFPTLNNILRKSEKEKNDVNNKDIILAALTYINMHKSDYSFNDGDTISVSMSNLISEQFIDNNHNNKDSVVCHVNSNKNLDCQYTKYLSNYSNDCVKMGNICNIDTIKKGVSIDIMVNSQDKYKFYVISDDGSKLTLQMYRNIILDGTDNKIPWYNESNNSTKGPIDALEYLSNYTKNWTNIELLNYTYENPNYVQNDGFGYKSLNIKNGIASTISNDGVTKNEVNGLFRTRIITFEEIHNLGCSVGNVKQTCPAWMVDFLYDTQNVYAGNNNNSNYAQGYWSLTTRKNSNTVNLVYGYGGSYYTYVHNGRLGVRPVITIDKSLLT